MFLLTILLSVTPLQQEIPYKPDTEFSIRLDLSFKPRPLSSINKVEFSETIGEHEKRTNTDLLPFLILFVSIKETNQGEVRMKILRDGKVFVNNRKLELGKEFKLEIGYTDDAKDKISGFEHIIYFLSADKKEINKIIITIEENGDYFVNGQKRGRI